MDQPYCELPNSAVLSMRIPASVPFVILWRRRGGPVQPASSASASPYMPEGFQLRIPSQAA